MPHDKEFQSVLLFLAPSLTSTSCKTWFFHSRAFRDSGVNWLSISIFLFLGKMADTPPFCQSFCHFPNPVSVFISCVSQLAMSPGLVEDGRGVCVFSLSYEGDSMRREQDRKKTQPSLNILNPTELCTQAWQRQHM